MASQQQQQQQAWGMQSEPTEQVATPITSPVESDQQTRLSQDLICSHPLYPLLSLIFQKCELATSASGGDNATSSPNLSSVAAEDGGLCPSSSFDEEIARFARELEESDTGAFTGDEELDSVMIQAIQVLRFHLLELEKVHELCDNFCTRYISCLKGKIVNSDSAPQQQQQQHPCGAEQAASHSGSSSSPPSAPPNPVASPSYAGVSVTFPPPDSNNYNHLRHQRLEHQQPLFPSSQQSPVFLPNAFSSQQLPLPPPPLLTADGRPVSEPPVPQNFDVLPVPSYDASLGSAENSATHQDDEDLNGVDEKADLDTLPSIDEKAASGKQSRQKKRGIFPKTATNNMRAWLFQNLSHPYPTEEQKKRLASETGLTILQVNNWFINARRRIVQPMIDQSNNSATSQDSIPDAAVFASYAAAAVTEAQKLSPTQFCYSRAGLPVPHPTMPAAAATAFPCQPHLPSTAAFPPQPLLGRLHPRDGQRLPHQVLSPQGQYNSSFTGKLEPFPDLPNE